MKRCFLLCALLMVPLRAQTVAGTVEKIEKETIQLKGPNGTVAIHTDEKTTVRKGKTTHDLSTLAVGDEIRANFYGDDVKTAVDISAKVTLSGLITAMSTSNFTLVPAGGGQPSAEDASTADRRSGVFIYLPAGVKLGVSRSQLTVGKRVHVVGWDAGDGVVDADRIAIYDTDTPLHPPARLQR